LHPKARVLTKKRGDGVQLKKWNIREGKGYSRGIKVGKKKIGFIDSHGKGR